MMGLGIIFVILSCWELGSFIAIYPYQFSSSSLVSFCIASTGVPGGRSGAEGMGYNLRHDRYNELACLLTTWRR
jgi:hypothetical protein